jgi:hypothetical protein
VRWRTGMPSWLDMAMNVMKLESGGDNNSKEEKNEDDEKDELMEE